MKPTIFKECTAGITYYGSSMKPECYVRHGKINQPLHSITEKINSLDVHILINKSLQFPERVYLLAAFIQQEFPELPWNWSNQLYELESRIRRSKYEGEYFEKTGVYQLAQFDSDNAAIIWEHELHLFLERCESYSLLEQKVLIGIAKHFAS